MTPPPHGPAPEGSAGRGRTRADGVRVQLADDIVRGDLPPGTPLDEAGLARRFGVSRTPVREALRDLSASGLVEIRPHRGAVVSEINLARLHAMFEAMGELEAACARLAAGAMTAAERAGLEAIHETLRLLVRSGDPQRYHEVNEAFHSAIYAGAHNPYLADLTLTTRTRLQPFRRAQFRTMGRLARSFEEHDVVVRALLRGDRDGAAQAIRDHIGTVETAFGMYLDMD